MHIVVGQVPAYLVTAKDVFVQLLLCHPPVVVLIHFIEEPSPGGIVHLEGLSERVVLDDGNNHLAVPRSECDCETGRL